LNGTPSRKKIHEAGEQKRSMGGEVQESRPGPGQKGKVGMLHAKLDSKRGSGGWTGVGALLD